MTAPSGRTGGGYIALALLTTGIGLLLCSVANALARATVGEPMLLYWAGVLLIAAPIFWRLTSREASKGERLALLCTFGLGLYMVKVIRDASMFTFSDEIVHSYNAGQIAVHGALFEPNEILRVTPFYPGLENVTAALMDLTGLAAFGAGTIVIAAARLTLVMALFFLFDRVSGSARTAGLAVAIFAGNFNFLLWGAQYSYASLSLPLLAVVLMALAERERTPREWGREWAVPVLLGTAAIVVTHHLTSYALIGLLGLLAGIYWLVRRTWGWANPWRFVVVAIVLAVGWMLLVATDTLGYLAAPLSEAFEAVFQTASGDEATRGLFEQNETATEATPALARGVSLLAIGLLAAALPFGLLALWRRYRDDPFAIAFGLAALGFFATLMLRLVPKAWESSNRASEFLFLGLAFTIACAGLELWRPLGSRRLMRGLLTAGLSVVLIGGAISGWPWDLQLATPQRAKARSNDATIVAPALAASEFARDRLPEDALYAANEADARMLMVPGERIVLAGRSPDIKDIVTQPGLSGWELPLLREYDVRYLVVDRREIAQNALKGYTFRIEGRPQLMALRPVSVISKFKEFPNTARIYSSGNIAVFDLEAMP